MAHYTDEQKSTIEYLINRGKAVHKRIEEAEFGAELDVLEDELNHIRYELKYALNAEAIYREHLKIAKEHLEAAEEIMKRWHGGEN